ncbi:hypothetical protein [Cognataquiflexum aquatile]|uniref:hypothetical protein n=1 Tax=Cognataquiflexum aquatile TaxID=2249427 RepID=UPI001300229A|nr:hypothetical protein [Cognataquiflexum aquatile]
MELLEENKPSFVLELQSGGKFKYLSVLDGFLICNAMVTEDCMGWHNAYLQNYISKNDLLPSKNSGRRLWFRVSGNVKTLYKSDDFVGNPFVLTNAERILSCPVNYQVVAAPVPLMDTVWKMIGFVDDKNKVYSHPACESRIIMTFTSKPLDDYPQNLPDGKRIEVHTGNYLFNLTGRALSYSVIENSNKIRLKYLSSPFFILGVRNYVMHDGPTTLETIQKSDSLFLLLSTDTLDYELENNILKLQNSKKKLNAMFVAN